MTLRFDSYNRQAVEIGAISWAHRIMQVIVNGKERELTGGISVSDLLDLYELEPIRAAVEINEELVPRATFSNTTIQPGDRIEIVTFVGGG